MATRLATGLMVIVACLGSFEPACGEVEFGIDGSVIFPEGGTDVIFNLPVQQIRAGFFVNEHVSIEPVLAMRVISAANTVTTLGLGANVLFHFSPDRTKTRGYVGGGPGYTYVDVGRFDDGQFSIAIEGGVKIPLGDVVAFRLSGGYERTFDPGANIGSLRFGLSFFAGD